MRLNALRVLFVLLGAALMHLGAAAPTFAQTGCSITGPSTVGANQSFTLCGPTGSRYSYEWHGPGLGPDSEERCVTVRMSNAGTYQYQLILLRDGAEVDRCTKVVNIGGTTGGARSCVITGPNSIVEGGTIRLCAPNDGLHTYRWTGPSGFTATGACVTVDEEGTYYLTSRNSVTGSTRQCTHHVTGTGSSGGTCDIAGPATIVEGATVQLCAPARSNSSYRWSGPRGFTGMNRCATADEPGTYSVTIRNQGSGRTERCSHTLVLADSDPGGDEDPDEVVWDNCPRNLQFWRGVFSNSTSGSETNGLTRSDVQTIARRVDERSTYFNWGNDVAGMRDALNPGSPLTRRKQVARQFAALMANVVTGELNLGFQGGESIGLDLDTRVDYPGARTLGELIVVTDRMLRANRGNYARLNSTLTAINRGRGIGPVCE